MKLCDIKITSFYNATSKSNRVSTQSTTSKYCMALNPLSKELKRTGYGYRMTTGHGETAKRQLISHLLYMDDLQLYGRNSDQLDGLLHTVRTFSDDIQMKFGLDKCAVAHFVNGRLSGHNPGVTVGKTETINRLEPGQVLGCRWE